MSEKIKAFKVINLPVGDIKVSLYAGEDPDSTFTGTISSSLKNELVDPEDEDTAEIAAAVDTLESFVLACACEGIDIESKPFVNAIEGTLEAISNNLS